MKPIVDFNVFENYNMHVMKPQNIENGEIEQNMISDKYQYKDNLFLNNSIGDIKWNQINDAIR